MKNKIATMMIATIVGSVFSCNQTQQKSETADSTVNPEVTATSNEPVVQHPTKLADKKLLLGTWTRTDAPYQINISEFLEDGNIKAEYLNPKSIHVGKANWSSVDGLFKIYVELQDENYPGSNYTLVYYPDKDLLVGKYFQAVEGTTYDVGFSRAK